ncbi:MAG: O-sialoglycoprotein endopeptidase [Phascolarctobacterium sp.]|uniref:Kae1-like domain-containing protein n=1 Tax=Phascolarctobacterium sp. TaxID=2049039 RepID=UPI0026DA904B|nr:O-sialoglycoprotein endopeptidase [Phascolarctobacterium sp.]MDO4921111.1 O-sialoglycoprotein endopeptidase [Phascolarctobacterium sp.]
MSRKVYLGLDTSCYTTSVAVLAEDGGLLGEARRILSVKPGRCGLQQSEMVFQHTRNLPELVESVLQGKDYELAAIGVSGYPRPLENSYMPAFLAGLSVARSLAALTGAKLEIISHQENHLEAGVWSAGGPWVQRFLLLHASGGTTDLLLAERQDNGRCRITQVGGSIDLHAGQFVDRVGVALGLQFPAGRALERVAAGAEARAELPVSVRKLNVSLSGPCTAALRALERGTDGAALALGVEYALGETFARLLRNGAAAYDVQDALLVGGVGSNQYIRQHVEAKLAKRGVRLWVPEGRFSCDNAAGCAALAWRMNCKHE